MALGQRHFRDYSSTVLKPELLGLDTQGRFVRGCRLGRFLGRRFSRRAAKLLDLTLRMHGVVGRLRVLTDLLLHLMQALLKITLLLRCGRAFLGPNALACLLVTLARALWGTRMAFAGLTCDLAFGSFAFGSCAL